MSLFRNGDNKYSVCDNCYAVVETIDLQRHKTWHKTNLLEEFLNRRKMVSLK